jgi:hypothetical protein
VLCSAQLHLASVHTADAKQIVWLSGYMIESILYRDHMCFAKSVTGFALSRVLKLIVVEF